MQNRFRTKAGFAKVTAISVLFAWLAPNAVAIAAEGEVERTLAIVELRTGNEASALTTDYLKEVGQAFRDENSGDYILVAPEKSAEKLRKDRDQVPTALTEERRAALTEARKRALNTWTTPTQPTRSKRYRPLKQNTVRLLRHPVLTKRFAKNIWMFWHSSRQLM